MQYISYISECFQLSSIAVCIKASLLSPVVAQTVMMMAAGGAAGGPPGGGPGKFFDGLKYLFEEEEEDEDPDMDQQDWLTILANRPNSRERRLFRRRKAQRKALRMICILAAFSTICN